jgi:hypothetical protein
MTIEIHNAELEGLLRRYLTAGEFASVEDLLLQTLRRTQETPDSSAEGERKLRASRAAERIRELRRGTTLDRPAGVSLREFAHIGHKY